MNARVTGDPPAPRKFSPEMNPALEEVILHALERDPKKRYAERRGDEAGAGRIWTRSTITHRDQRLRAPQPWKGKSHTALMIAAIVVFQIGLFFALFLLLSRKHH